MISFTDKAVEKVQEFAAREWLPGLVGQWRHAFTIAVDEVPHRQHESRTQQVQFCYCGLEDALARVRSPIADDSKLELVRVVQIILVSPRRRSG